MKRHYLISGLAALAVIVMTCQAQPPRRGIRNRARSPLGNLYRLLDMQPVRKEIELRPLQIQMLDDLQADLLQQHGVSMGGRRRPGQPSFDPEARTRIEAIYKQGEQLIAVILDEAQARRLDELRLQDEGVRAFDRQELRQALELSDEQFEKIGELRRQAAGGSRSPARREEALKGDVLDLLTDEQRARLKEMQGEDFEFPLPADLGGLRDPNDDRGARGRSR